VLEILHDSQVRRLTERADAIEKLGVQQRQQQLQASGRMGMRA